MRLNQGPIIPQSVNINVSKYLDKCRILKSYDWSVYARNAIKVIGSPWLHTYQLVRKMGNSSKSSHGLRKFRSCEPDLRVNFPSLSKNYLK